VHIHPRPPTPVVEEVIVLAVEGDVGGGEADALPEYLQPRGVRRQLGRGTKGVVQNKEKNHASYQVEYVLCLTIIAPPHILPPPPGEVVTRQLPTP